MALGLPVVPLENKIQMGSLKPPRSKVGSAGSVPTNDSKVWNLVRGSFEPARNFWTSDWGLTESGRWLMMTVVTGGVFRAENSLGRSWIRGRALPL